MIEKTMFSNEITPNEIPELNRVYKIRKQLGQGGEGSVYLVKDDASQQERILKIFHKPLHRSQKQWDWLRLYANSVTVSGDGFFPITLIQNPDQMVGVTYPYTRLHELHWRIYLNFEQVAQALFGSYCRMQSHLMSYHGMGLIDGNVENFMLADDGNFHYIDYGTCIMPVNREQPPLSGAFGYSFFMMLLSIYHINIKFEATYTDNYSYTKPCVYSQTASLDRVAAQHPWMAEIVSEVRQHKATIFLEPDFYQQLSERLPNRLERLQQILWANSFFMSVKKIRDWGRRP
ncbi:MAG: hypothetical protein GY796_01510 [Chloroflexi bacterium]|nr:hypothetical protein [Chloroflexota bacterium]